MNQGWEIKTLNQISVNLDSKRVPITKNIRSSGEVPYYGASGIVDYVREYLFDDNLLLVSEDGANLLARTYPIAFSISGKTWVNNHAHVLKFRNIVTQKFIELYLNSIQLDEFVSGMAQPKLNQAMLNKIPIPFPSIQEQQYLVETLKEAFEAIIKAKANAEQNLKNAKELFESYLESVFTNKDSGWEEKKLGQICKKISDGSHNPPKGIDSSEYLMLSSKNVFNDNINLDSPRYLKKKDFETENKRTEIETGDVLLTIVGTIGRVAVVSDDFNYFTLQRSVAVLKSNNNIINSRFLMYSLRNIFDELTDSARGVAQKGLYLNQIRSIEISIPTLTKQQSIVQKLDALLAETKKLETIYQQKLNDLEELKKSILQKAFNCGLKTS